MSDMRYLKCVTMIIIRVLRSKGVSQFRMLVPGGGHTLQWTIRGGSARKGYLFQSGGI